MDAAAELPRDPGADPSADTPDAGLFDLPPDPGPDVSPGCPGAAGCACTLGSDCFDGYCLEVLSGWACAALCQGESSCGPGFACVQVSPPGADVVNACVDPFARLCRPCLADADCGTVAVPGVSVSCLERGPEGRFCAVTCPGEVCPEGFACEAAGLDRVKVCLPEGGAACPCPDKNKAFKTKCFVKNDFGTCLGERTCDTACSAATPAPETCNGLDDDCNGKTDDDLPATPCDLTNEFGTCKGETWCLAGGQAKCVGTAPDAEVCDSKDNDCDGNTDEAGAKGCGDWYADQDKDGYGVTADALCLCQASAPYTAKEPGDCDDADPAVHPGTQETCNGKDDDCDGKTDPADLPGCKVFFADADSDGAGDPGIQACLCGPTDAYPALAGDDCDDTDPDRNPGLPEACDHKDNDCDGETDEGAAAGCATYYRDDDGDGYGVADSRCACGPGAPFTALAAGDCDDADPEVHPGAVESCNGRDDDCDNAPDPAGSTGCTTYHADNDGDGHGAASDSNCLCLPVSPYTAAAGDDCDDTAKDVHPGADEACNLADDDCDGKTDEDLGTLSCGVGTCAASVPACTGGVAGTCVPGKPGIETCNGLDDDCDGVTDEDLGTVSCGVGACAVLGPACRDGKAATCSPGTPAAETCDGTDDDCDGVTDEPDSLGCVPYWRDVDKDGAGGTVKPSKCLCGPDEDADYTATVAGDCDDLDNAVHPGAAEACNGRDDDCDGETDEGLGTVSCGVGVCAATVPACTDGKPGVCGPGKPGLEACDGRDDDCDGETDEGLGTLSCGVGVCAATVPACVGGKPGECVPGKPGPEACNDLDDDCDGATDEPDAAGCADRFQDADQDGFGEGDPACLCVPIGIYTASAGGDCDDADPAVSPGAAEACNGQDDDCDGMTDEADAVGCKVYGYDKDGDLHPDPTKGTKCLCSPAGYWNGTKSADCNDNDAGIHPDAAEVCNNGKDDDCDGNQDEEGASGCVDYWRDIDGDGYGSTLKPKRCLCAPDPVGDFVATQGGDCNDFDPLAHPKGQEACNGRDDDCDGLTDEGLAALCDDANPCTEDSCDPVKGCIHPAKPDKTACDDGNACTGGDVCLAGKCSGTGLTCDDNNPCTSDTCDVGLQKCVYTNHTNACDDGNRCTVGETCSAGKCGGGAALPCGDGNVCTTDSCDPATGCRYANNTLTCAVARCEGGKYLAATTCAAGACPAQVATSCDDGKVCTTDSCDAALGCLHANNLDVCAAAKCEGGKFFPAAMCSGGLCSNSVSTSCDDGNVCTTDTCDTTKGCMHANNTTTCTAPRCEGGKFFPTAICSGGTCPVQVGTTCDDGLSCSLDTCDPALGCVFTAGTQPLYDDFGTDSTSKFQGCFGFSLGWVPDGHITIQYKGSTGYGQYLATGWTAGEGTYTVKVREDDDANTFGAAILLKVSKTCSSGHKFIRYGIYHTTGEVIISKYNGSGTHLFKENRGIKANQWYKLTVVVSGSHYVFLLDDVPVFATEIQDPVFAGLMGVGLSIDDNYGKASKLVHFDDLAFTPAPLVRNGGFEEGFAGWSNGINPWGGSSYGQYTTSSEAHSGSVSIHSSIGQIVWQYLPLPCVPATTARFKWWVKGDCGIASGKYTTVFLQALDASGGILGEKQSKCFGNQPLWTEMSESMSLPSGMSKLLLAITSANGSGGYKTSAFLDDVSVEYLP